jgi:CheY-like chemotaxis protein
VDDEPVVRNLLQAVLERQGFTVWLAANGQEAIQLYRQYRTRIDLVLLDVRMPDYDGPQTLAALQRHYFAAVCCFMTGQAGDYTEADLLKRGAARVFAKPFVLAELRASLGQLLQGHQI